MKKDLSRLSAAFFIPAESSCDACWKPLVDVYRGHEAWLVKFDLAGVRPEDVQVVVQGRRLTVRGMRRDWLIQEGRETYSLEISYNSFKRTVELPFELERVAMHTQFRDGMFIVSFLAKENSNA